jgi:hypothetical protein
MIKSLLVTALTALAAAMLAPAPPASADGMKVRTHHHRSWHHRRFILLPERHVVEVNRPTNSGYFIINGTRFTATTAHCASWAAGERIRLLAGDWNGACSTAVFYNVRRRQTCEMWCR